MKDKKIFKLVELAILIALVVLLQLFVGNIRVGATNFSLVLIPIVLGAITLGPSAGALLGFTFGAITLIQGITGQDPFTAILLNSGLKGAIITPLICLGKGTAAGLGAGLIYKLLKNKNGFVATIVASAAAPILNTGLFIIGALFLSDVLAANFVAEGTTVIYFLIFTASGINFITEFAVNLVASPAIHRVINAFNKGRI
ncbi:MAG: ECF transporter S component [Clostridia bacterium]|nr:ECF transporter S component [Clostridia bacterium]